jgi:hypothetical protein
VDELDLIISRTRAHGPPPLLLDGWERASIWGWDGTAGSLYAHLWRNTDDPGKAPAIRIEPGDYTSVITLLTTLSQHIAMATDTDPWDVLVALEKIVDQDQNWRDEGGNAGATKVTMTDGYSLPDWPYRPQPR